MNEMFKNKRVIFEFEHSNEEIKVKGQITIDATTKNTSEISGHIYKLNDNEEMVVEIGSFNINSVSVNSSQYFSYRTPSSQLIDEVMSQAMTDVTSLI